MSFLDWSQPRQKILLNPRLPQAQQKKLVEAVRSHSQEPWIWLQSSGTEIKSQGDKLVALSFDAFLRAAESVANFYDLSSQDVWLNPLPGFHVGGLSIGARCFVSGAQEVPFQQKWSPVTFVEQLQKVKATWTSLVPTQLYDIIKEKIPAPESIKVVLVGGGALTTELTQEALDLGWPLIPSYGMTETCAMIAGTKKTLKPRDNPRSLTLLPHVEMRSHGDGRFSLKSASLFSGYLIVSEQGDKSYWISRPEPFVIDDRLLQLAPRTFEILGRDSELVKILGETVNLAKLRERIEKKVACAVAIIALPEARRGHELHLFLETAGEGGAFSPDSINAGLLPFERVAQVHGLEKLPRSPLGKIQHSQLLALLEGMK